MTERPGSDDVVNCFLIALAVVMFVVVACYGGALLLGDMGR